jgi:L-malate glycosyltransferase
VTLTARRISAVHQVLPSLHVADASGSHTLRARDALREAGYESELFVGHADAPLVGQSRPFDELDRFVHKGSTVLLYQLAVGSVLVDHLLRRSEPLLVNYHNLTPADFFWKWAPDWLNAVETGRQQLHRLAPRVFHAIAVSNFNERDLRSAGYRSTSVVPPFVDVDVRSPTSTNVSQDGPDPHRARTVSAGSRDTSGARWLFVGKLLPHKAAHDLLKALAVYRSAYDPDATLTVVGGHPVPQYAKAVTDYADALGLTGVVELTGSVSQGVLEEKYSSSDVFVCLSQHEGFCFPLLEAMDHELPVVAWDAAAVGDTLAHGGLLLPDKEPANVAAAVHRVVSDTGLRERLVSGGRSRLVDFSFARTRKRFLDAIHSAIELI